MLFMLDRSSPLSVGEFDQYVEAANTRHDRLESKIDTLLELVEVRGAFVKDNAGEPDYSGHLEMHKAWQREIEARRLIFRRLVEWGLISLLTGIVAFVGAEVGQIFKYPV